VTDILDAIHEDHANMVKMLNALERQLAVFDAGETPDYDIVRGVVDYCLDYPDLYHHPKEDLVFERLKVRDPAAAAEIGDLPGQHAELAVRTRRLQEAVAAVLGDLEVPRGRLDETLREFLDAYRQHMNEEERAFLPAARRVLSAEDLAEIQDRLDHPADPLFGAPSEERFAALRQDILNWAEDAT
jgi:hemerythrin-like domain-containing protein